MTKTAKDYPVATGTPEEIQAWIDSFMEDRDLTVEKIWYEDYNTEKAYKGYILEQVNSTGGSEGAGEYMDITYAIRDKLDSTKVLGYIQFQGCYNSWDSSELYDEIHIVSPVDVTTVEFK